MSRRVRDIFKTITSALVFASVILGVLTGCNSSESGESSIDNSTAAAPEESWELVETSATDTPTPTPSLNIPHMNAPEVDVTAPFFLNLPENVSIEKGEEFNIDSYIGYIDDCDSDVELTIDGEVDTANAGSYPLTLTITDDAGNSKTGNLNVKVYVPEPSSGGGGGGTSEHVTLAYDDFKARYPGEDIAYGIDVSRYQGDIDFNKVKAAGCDFVMLRAMIYNNGELGEDKKFEEYYKDAKAAGLLVGVYYFTTDSTIEELRAHTDELLKVLEGKELDLPVAFDWESWSHFQKYHMSIVDINNLFYEFAGMMEANGLSTILYASKYYLEIIWVPAGYDVWLAHYVKETDYGGDYTMWQTGSIGVIDGVPEECDTDILFKSRYPELFGGQ